MPSMANIAVEDAAAATVTYTASVPSAGDRSPAVWRQNAASGIIGHRPTLSVVTRDNQKQNGRVFEAHFKYPITVEVEGEVKVAAIMPFTISGTLPTNVDSADVQDGFIQMGNLLVSTLIRDVALDGYAPT